MLHIHQTTCISPQRTFPHPDLEELHESVNSRLSVIEPDYTGIPQNALRRMARSTRIGVGAAFPLLRRPEAGSSYSSVTSPPSIDGIIIGTANAGMEESIQFMKQIIDHEEGMLAPGVFVQSTPNTIAAQISLLSRNRGYNTTHVHRGLAFENALLDAAMLVRENPRHNYLLGGVDEIGAFNYNIDYLDGWYKKEALSSKRLYEDNSAGSIAGEGAALFLVNDRPENALARVRALATLHSKDPAAVRDQLRHFIDTRLQAGEKIDLFLSGENGDNRLLPFFLSCEDILDRDIPIARFKHMCGEYPTASAFAVWLACHLLQSQSIPPHIIKRMPGSTDPGNRGDKNTVACRNILIYNSHKGAQHSFIWITGTHALTTRPDR
ncbi:MAG: hypothetical protein P4L51_29360 [Puia sp.]|nr:hypothetical protein [Puia sp.]